MKRPVEQMTLTHRDPITGEQTTIQLNQGHRCLVELGTVPYPGEPSEVLAERVVGGSFLRITVDIHYNPSASSGVAVTFTKTPARVFPSPKPMGSLNIDRVV